MYDVKDCVINENEYIMIGEERFEKISGENLKPIEKEALAEIQYMAFYTEDEIAYTFDHLYRNADGRVLYLCSQSLNKVYELHIGGYYS